MNAPPDAYIERHWLNDAPPSLDPCEDGVCGHTTHCDGCTRPMNDYSETGFCDLCLLEWNAQHQLTPFAPSEQTDSVEQNHTRRQVTR